MSVICSIVKTIVGEKTGYGKITSLICGIFLAVTLISPLVDLEISDLIVYPSTIRTDAHNIAAQAYNDSRLQLRTIIKDQTEAYILDKAASINADIQVEIQLHDEEAIPVGVVIDGNIAPYNKTVLSRYMEETLGLAEDVQIWDSNQ